MNDVQKKKKKFRNSKRWKEFRHLKNVEQKGLDPITLGKIRKGSNLHHLNLSAEDYEDLSNPDDFVLLNHNTHETLHFLYTYYRKDEGILDRFKHYLDLMKKIEEKK